MNGMYLSPDKQGVVLARDNQRCVVCEGTADEVCSILDLRLWDTFTFDAHNWVSLCATHAAAVKNGLFHPAELRSLARIDSILVPAQCYQTFTYDRWGNQILSSGERVRGELVGAEVELTQLPICGCPIRLLAKTLPLLNFGRLEVGQTCVNTWGNLALAPTG